MIETLPAPETPSDLLGKMEGGDKVLLEGAGWFDGRFSLFGMNPFATFQSRGASSRFDYLGSPGKSYHAACDPLSHLQRWLDHFHPSSPLEVTSDSPALPFLYGGAVGFFSYDLVQQFEAVPPHHSPVPDVPDVHLLFLNLYILFDTERFQWHILYNANLAIAMGETKDTAIKQGTAAIRAVRAKLQSKVSSLGRYHQSVSMTMEDRRDAYLRKVQRAKAYIAAGDIFQANLSTDIVTPADNVSLVAVYRQVRRINPSPFSAYLNIGDIEAACSSPERLLRVSRDRVETCPIAGTRMRGRDAPEDLQMIRALYDSPKERAEHLMLVDLERNDLGKICRYGSVEVETLMALEKYSHVFHLVSRLSGKPLPGVKPLEAFRALFPGGTITGVPKVRCMEIIAELEDRGRGLYTGAMGYIGFDGEMDMNIVIRTWIRYNDQMILHVGAGIVADSDPEAEYREICQKAAAMIEALKAGTL